MGPRPPPTCGRTPGGRVRAPRPYRCRRAPALTPRPSSRRYRPPAGAGRSSVIPKNPQTASPGLIRNVRPRASLLVLLLASGGGYADGQADEVDEAGGVLLVVV